MMTRVAVLLSCFCLAGCGSREAEPPRPAVDLGHDVRPGSVGEASRRPRIVVLGDSLTAGYGLASPDRAFPARLQARLDRDGYRYEVVNAGVSGDTTAGGLRRLDWALTGDVRIVVISLGGNDGLRGLSLNEMKRNLTALVQGVRARGAAAVLAGMEAPPNLGPEYTARFRTIYREVAREQQVPLLPFLLEGIAGAPDLNQSDGIHPNEEGARRMADLLWPTLEPLLDRRAAQ